jgi:flagellar biosynthetic protein FliQ
MTSGEILQISHEALWTMLKVGAPLILIALAVGVLISFLQALTQIQEMTLSFVPKILGMVTVLFFLLPYMGKHMMLFSQIIFDKIVSAG